MGISANQARLMTLTARQHDLELRAQQISAQKMIKSLNSQKWAMEYSEKLNLFTQQKQGLQPCYRKEVPTPITKEWLDSKGYYLQRVFGGVYYPAPAGSNYDELVNSGIYAVSKSFIVDSNTLTNQWLYKMFTRDGRLTENFDVVNNINRTQYFEEFKNAYCNCVNASWDEIISDIRGKGITALETHFFQIYETPAPDGTGSYKIGLPLYSTDPSAMFELTSEQVNEFLRIIELHEQRGITYERFAYEVISDRPAPTLVEVPYEELDINVIKAEYDAAVSSLTADEKLLDMELTQINTEHKAVKTEYDSIKSLIGENVDKSFNVFG